MSNAETYASPDGLEIAIIGMAGRFPQAKDLQEFWENLRNGVESISFFTDEQVAAAGVDPAILKDPHYVKAGGVLEDVDLFDGSFFGFYPREAAVLDPQHRIFLECSWEALENAGYDPEAYRGYIGVFAGASMNTYLVFNLIANREIVETVHPYQLTLGNDKDFLPTRVSYKLNLRGPSLNIQTACSTSLVAVHLACQSLLSYQADIALAGGVAIRLPQKQGYLYQEGGIASPDGHCRAFDAKAQGTISGEGVGIVVLKRLLDALADGDTVHAVIKGSAINNDGSLKVGYTAPSVEGQAEVIAMAQAISGVEPASISYVEAHGTGTALGDPIEITALNQVFQATTADRNFCAIGSVKTNIGHLDAAAGVASLIKTALALKYGQIPPSLHFEAPNPKIDFNNSPFYVNNQLSEWPTGSNPRRAGVSSFGIGGTNAHVVLEEAPVLPAPDPSRPWKLLLLSARSPAALDVATGNLSSHLRQQPDLDLADVAYTLQVGRRAFDYRRIVISRDIKEARESLDSMDPHRVTSAVVDSSSSTVAFMFTGQGAQYANMAGEIYQNEPVFHTQVDLCAEILRSHLGLDLRDLLFPGEAGAEAASERLKQTFLTQPALFTIEYALAKLWMAWGIQPEAMIGHSIGEYVAACLAGVFTLEDALALVSARGRMMQGLPGGAMLSVPLAEDAVRPYLGEEISLAAVNAPELCVVSGPYEAIENLAQRLAAAGIEARRLHTSHAFHSPMMDPILDAFRARVAQVILHAPEIPFLSNVSGMWITAAEATDPSYWANHLRQTVRFAQGVGELLKEPARILLEVGPGRTLATLAKSHPSATRARVILPSIRHPHDPQPDLAFLLTSLGRLWLAGVKVDWEGYYGDERRRRLPLPTYPFERQRYWIEPQGSPLIGQARPAELRKQPDVADWFYVPAWKRSAPLPSLLEDKFVPGACWIIFGDGSDLEAELVTRLAKAGQEIIRVHANSHFSQLAPDIFVLNPARRRDYTALFEALQKAGRFPEAIVHLWSLAGPDGPLPADEWTEQALGRSFYSLLFLAQALGEQNITRPIQVAVLSTNVQDVTGDEALVPEKAPLLGPCKVVPQEHPNLVFRSIDVAEADLETGRVVKLAAWLLAEINDQPADRFVAYRGGYRWLQTYENLPARLETGRLRERGVYLLTGGMGRIGLALAEHLARSVQARLILVDRVTFPSRAEWTGWLAEHVESDTTSLRIHKLLALEAMGAEVMVSIANVADRNQMQAVVDGALARFGALHGVVHAAGLVGEDSIKAIPDTTLQDCQAQFQSKLYGLRVLEAVLRDVPLDFCLLQSSLSAVLGGLGLVAYASANLYMDAFATLHNRTSPVPWISVDWDGWRFGDGAGVGTTLATLSIDPEEGIDAFGRALALDGMTHLVVSTANLDTRLDQWIRRDNLPEVQGVESKAQTSYHARPNLRTSYAAPQTELEQTIAGMWGKVLGIQEIGVHDDFFELGGHSLLATQLVSRLRDAYHVELPLPKLFESPTVAGLAALIEAARGLTTAEPARSIQPALRTGNLPLSFGQQRLWFLDQLEPDSPLYNNFAAIRMRGRLDIAALEASINEIVRRHAALRTTFHAVDGQPVQVVAPEMAVPVEYVNLADLDEEARDSAVLRLAHVEARRPFKLAEGPLFRASVLRLAESDHVVFLTMHHIISDGWSVGVLLVEFGTLYTALSGGKTDVSGLLPELPIQYSDFAVWQREWMQAEVLEEQLQYWKGQLAYAPAALELPTDRPRPAVQTSNGASLWFELSEGLSTSLAQLSKREGVTNFMLLLAALQTLLFRYTGQEDICVGTPIANRNRVETEPLIGFVLNTLVMRTDLSGDPGFRQLLERARATALGAYAHQDLPFEMLVEALQPLRDRSRSPLFQVIFDLQSAPLQALELPGLTITPLQIDSGTAKFDLALSMENAADGSLRGFLNYNTDLFEAETISRMLGHFQTLLEGIVANPDCSLSTLPMLTEAERRKLLHDWNRPAAPLSYATLIHQLFEAQVEKSPAATALISADDSRLQLTYQELNRRANQLASYLRRQGVGPEVIVGQLVERSIDAIVGFLAILKAGGAYLPLDPAVPLERLVGMLEDARVPVLLTHSAVLERTHLAQALPAIQTKAVCLDGAWAVIALDGDQNLETVSTGENLAYVIYTSGSSGKPKGVMISNGAIASHCLWIVERFQLTARDRALQFSSYSFDQSIEQILAPLVTGATLVLRGPEIWDPASFSKVILDNDLTVVNIPPAYWNQWVLDWNKAGNLPAAGSAPGLGRLRLVIIGGDVMLSESLRAWEQTPMKAARLLNAYGPTETTITALTYDCPTGLNRPRIPIGRPVGERPIYILDRHGKLVPSGVPGELYIGGAALARGYLNQLELTAEKFITDPSDFGSSRVNAGRLYRTGDLVRYLPGGEVEFLGRVDQQVKIRGFRIELGEIEVVLSRHPGLREVVVVAREDTPGDKRLVAYLVSELEQPPGPTELRDFLKERLPEYMLPSAFVTLAALPLNASGKVDRRALPAPEFEHGELARIYVAPRTPVEAELAQLWAQILGIQQVGIQDSFFDLGGHSLLATQIVSRVRETYKIELPLRELFETPTVAGLASLITQNLVEQASPDDLSDLLSELEGLSDEEVQRLLNGENS